MFYMDVRVKVPTLGWFRYFFIFYFYFIFLFNGNILVFSLYSAHIWCFTSILHCFFFSFFSNLPPFVHVTSHTPRLNIIKTYPKKIAKNVYDKNFVNKILLGEDSN